MSSPPVSFPIWRDPRFWAANALAWALLAVANSGAIYADLVRAGREGSWLVLWSNYLLYYLPWFLWTPVVFAWVRRYPWVRGGWRRHAGGYVLFIVGWLLLYVPIAGTMVSLVAHGAPVRVRESIASVPLNAWVLDSVFLLTLLGVANARQLAEAARERRLESSRLALENAELSARWSGARLQMLRAQLEPHFLFNSLNTITALIRSAEPETAVRSVGLLSELLRYATRAATVEAVALDEELDFVEAYLAFQRMRFADRLDCQLEVDAEAAEVEVPPLLLQPLLENAIRHGVERFEGPSEVRLEVRLEGSGETRGESRTDADRLVLSVVNCPGSELEASSGLGVGLSNTRERLEAVYGEQTTLRQEAVDGCYRVEVTLPVERPAAAATMPRR